MEDQNIKNLFKEFQPELSSSSLFLTELENKLDTIELIRKQNSLIQRQYKIAIGISAFCGMVIGSILTLMFPILQNLITLFFESILNMPNSIVSKNYGVETWILISGFVLFFVFNVYEIMLSVLFTKTPTLTRECHK